jgi:glucose-6-phosphate 1-epimerase
LCSTAEGAVFHHGAHVTDWTPHGAEPVLWLSQNTDLDSDSVIRGGVSICWPWYGAGIDGVASPLHGFASRTEWRLLDVAASEQSVCATYLLIDAPSDQFEFPHRLYYKVCFGEKFSASFTVRNTGSRRFTFEEALHAYVHVKDVRNIVLSGLDGSKYLDRVPGNELGPHAQVGKLILDGETDRIYHSKAQIRIDDPEFGRRISVVRTGSRDAVIWNPWAEKSTTVMDMAPGEWSEMIGIATANVAEHAVTLAPGKEHTMGFTLKVEPLLT